MPYLVTRKAKGISNILFWMGEITHVSMMKTKKIPFSEVSSIGYVTYRRDKADFFITWHTPFTDDQSPKITQEDKDKVLSSVRSIYGKNEIVKNQLADQFEEQEKKNAEIRKKLAMGR